MNSEIGKLYFATGHASLAGQLNYRKTIVDLGQLLALPNNSTVVGLLDAKSVPYASTTYNHAGVLQCSSFRFAVLSTLIWMPNRDESFACRNNNSSAHSSSPVHHTTVCIDFARTGRIPTTSLPPLPFTLFAARSLLRLLRLMFPLSNGSSLIFAVLRK